MVCGVMTLGGTDGSLVPRTECVWGLGTSLGFPCASLYTWNLLQRTFSEVQMGFSIMHMTLLKKMTVSSLDFLFTPEEAGRNLKP